VVDNGSAPLHFSSIRGFLNSRTNHLNLWNRDLQTKLMWKFKILYYRLMSSYFFFYCWGKEALKKNFKVKWNIIIRFYHFEHLYFLIDFKNIQVKDVDFLFIIEFKRKWFKKWFKNIDHAYNGSNCTDMMYMLTSTTLFYIATSYW